MAELKTKVTKASVLDYIRTIADSRVQRDARALLSICKAATGKPAKMWGSSMIGFDSYHYKSQRSSQEGDWPMVAFAPRKQNLTVYIMPGLSGYEALLKKLGTHKVSGGSCLYIKKLDDIDERVLAQIIKKSYQEMKKKYRT